MVKAFHATSSTNVLVLEAARYLRPLTLLLRNFLKTIRRPLIETVPSSDECYLVFVPIGFIELASSDPPSVILDDTLI